MSTPISVRLNGRPLLLEQPPARPLLDVLREDLALCGSRFGCGQGQCGACVVLVDGQPRPSCMLPVGEIAGRDIVTIEGLAQGDRLHPVQDAFLREDALQCGFCTSGMILAAVALLARNRSPSVEEIREALDGHLCRCGVYGRVVRAVARAAGEKP